eukprot:2427063-Prymnesium_polylepis.1
MNQFRRCHHPHPFGCDSYVTRIGFPRGAGVVAGRRVAVVVELDLVRRLLRRCRLVVGNYGQPNEMYHNCLRRGCNTTYERVSESP